MEEGEGEKEGRRIKEIERINVNDVSEIGGRKETVRSSGFEISSVLRRLSRHQQQREVELARRRSAEVIASARQNARESMDRIRNQIREIRHQLDVDHSPGGATDHQQTCHSTGTSSDSKLGMSRGMSRGSQVRSRRPDVTLNSAAAAEVATSGSICSDGACQRDRRRPPPPDTSSTYLRIQIDHSRSTGVCLSGATSVAMATGGASGLNRSVAGVMRSRGMDTSVVKREGDEAGSSSAAPLTHRGSRKGGRGGGGGAVSRGSREPAQQPPSSDRMRSVGTTHRLQRKHRTSDNAASHLATDEELSGASDSDRGGEPVDTRVDTDTASKELPNIKQTTEELEEEEETRRRRRKQEDICTSDEEGQMNRKERIKKEEEEDDDDDEEEEEEEKKKEAKAEQKINEEGGGGGESNDSGIPVGECLLDTLHQMEMIIQRSEMQSLEEGHQRSSQVRPEMLDGLWQIIASCKSAVESVEESGHFEVDEAFHDWMLIGLDKLGSICYRFVVALITELVEMSERCDWTTDEHRLYMDAAMLVRRTSLKMMEPVLSQQVSLRHSLAAPLVQILSIHLQNLRVILALFALVNLRSREEVAWSAAFDQALNVFVSEVAGYLLSFEDSLRQTVSARQAPPSPPVEYFAASDADSLQSALQGHWEQGHDDRGHRGVIDQTVSFPVYQNPYFYQTPYHQPPLHHLHHHYAPPAAENQAPPMWLYSVTPVFNSLSPSNDGSTDYEGDDQSPDYSSRDPREGDHMTTEEQRVFQSLLSEDQRMIPDVLPQSDPLDDYMLGFSVQVASQLISQTSRVLNRMTLNSESPDDTFDILISRSSETLLDDLVQLYTDAPRQLLHSRLNVVFEGEPGIDGGALSREFFCLLFRTIVDRTVKNRAVFEGQRGHLLPAIDHVLSESKVFWIVGVLVAQAVGNGCRGLPWLSPAVRRFLADGARVSDLEKISQLTSLEDVADLELRELLKKVVDRESPLSEEESLLWQNWLEKSGFSYVVSAARTDDAVQRILRYYVFESRMSQLLSIAEGMEELGWRPLPSGVDVDVVFPSGDEVSFDEFFRSLLINEPPAYSRHSTDVHRAFRFFRKFCIELSEGKIERLGLSDLLHFFTGAPYLKSGASLTFMTPDQEVIYPQARTCNLELIVPTMHQSYKDFRNAFCQALQLGSYGFGFA